MPTGTHDDEARRQQALLAVLQGAAPAETLQYRLGDAAPRARRGLQAYTANAGALAERALAAAFPTVTQLVGQQALAALARACWRAHPPLQGDVAQWGGALPGFIATLPDLDSEPYLADVARLDWAVHCCELAADADDTDETADAPGAALPGLSLLATADPEQLWLHPAAGTVLLASPYPVATIWRAHRSTAADRFAPVRAALASGSGEQALVWRLGLAAQVCALPGPAAGFTRAVLAGQALGPALDAADAAHTGFAFEPWLLAALQQGWLVAVDTRAFIPLEPTACAPPSTDPQP